MRQLTRRVGSDQYTLHDMARDTVALMQQAGLTDAHVAGMSMGGMIAKTIAANHPAQVRSLTSIFSTTGDRRAGKIALTTILLMGRPHQLLDLVQEHIDGSRALRGLSRPAGLDPDTQCRLSHSRPRPSTLNTSCRCERRRRLLSSSSQAAEVKDS